MNVRKSSIHLCLKSLATVLNRIDIRGIRGPFHNLNPIFLQPIYSICWNMYFCIILLKNRISYSILRLLPSVYQTILQNMNIYLSIDTFVKDWYQRILTSPPDTCPCHQLNFRPL